MAYNIAVKLVLCVRGRIPKFAKKVIGNDDYIPKRNENRIPRVEMAIHIVRRHIPNLEHFSAHPRTVLYAPLLG